jgi:hypothetical protein
VIRNPTPAWQFGTTPVEPSGDLILLLVVLALLVEYEVLSAYFGPQHRHRFRPLIVTLVPLFPVALFIVFVRMIDIR